MMRKHDKEDRIKREKDLLIYELRLESAMAIPCDENKWRYLQTLQTRRIEMDTITLPIATHSYNWVDASKTHCLQTFHLSSLNEKPVGKGHFDEARIWYCEAHRTRSCNVPIALPYDIVVALIDAAQHPVCPACEGKGVDVLGWGRSEDEAELNLFAQCSKCGCSGPRLDLETLPDEDWVSNQTELFTIAALRSPAVMWQWLKSLKQGE